MKTTTHAEMRMQQRGGSGALVEYIYEGGEEIGASRGATVIRIPEGERQTEIKRLRRELRLLEQAGGKAVLNDGDVVITFMSLTKKLRLDKRRSRNRARYE